MTAARPLTGFRLVSLAQNVPGPVAVARLVGLGALAVKIEPPDGDPLAALCRPWYDVLHAGVERRTLDLKSANGRLALDTLLADADVLITSQRPTALARLGLDPARAFSVAPQLRLVRIVGETADPERAGHDVTYQAGAGLVDDRLPATLLADMAGAERTVTAVLVALRSAPGTTSDVGLRDVVEALAAPLAYGMTAAGGLLGGGLPAYGVYPARDGHVAVAALEPHFRTRLYDALALPLDAPLAEVMATRTTVEWEAFASTLDLPIVVVRARC
jgi:alpha-methylacyl-CoA racemase